MKQKSEVNLKGLPNNWWANSAICQIFANLFDKHIVGLFIRGFEGNIQRQGIYTGFLVRYKGSLLWVTAGHVIEEIYSLENSGDYKIKEMRWLDGFEKPYASSVPVYNQPLDMFWKYDENIDFGVIRISGLEESLIYKNEKLIIMDEMIWTNLHLAKPDGFYIFGYPKEWTKLNQKRINEKQTIFSFLANLACLPIQKIEYSELPENIKEIWKDREAFYGKIIDFEDDNQLQPTSIKGMSGGPLVSIEIDKNEKYRYRLFGIQSKWVEGSRIICAESMEKLIGLFFN